MTQCVMNAVASHSAVNALNGTIRMSLKKPDITESCLSLRGVVTSFSRMSLETNSSGVKVGKSFTGLLCQKSLTQFLPQVTQLRTVVYQSTDTDGQ